MTLKELTGSQWAGTSVLWKDPLGDVAQVSDCTMAIDDGVLRYTWVYEGTAQEGWLRCRADGAEFHDSWHQNEPVACAPVTDSTAIVTVRYTYLENWGWRISLCHRGATDELVLQMTNVAPWGEEARAARMVCRRVTG
ncbi:MAG TPA: hypothetical protein VMW48_06290 [Vicinamibacterales bacterium]|nr:hypothetical protein [Vicinamibacterales bacterium]